MRCRSRLKTSTASSIRPNHLLRMLARGLSQLRTRQHACHFFGPFFSTNLAHGSLGATRSFTLLDQVMMVGKGCDLGQVSDAEHLIAFGESLQFLPHGLGGTPSNAGINFV